jgi:hypothetical protein
VTVHEIDCIFTVIPPASCGGKSIEYTVIVTPRRTAIVLCAGDKAGVSQRRFYEALIRKADTRFDAHLARLKEGRR